MRSRRFGSLKREPVFQAGAAKGVKTVQKGERLVEDVGAYLSRNLG